MLLVYCAMVRKLDHPVLSDTEDEFFQVKLLPNILLRRCLFDLLRLLKAAAPVKHKKHGKEKISTFLGRNSQNLPS